MTAGRPAERVGPAPSPSDLVTVVVETYNHESFIETSLRAVLEQVTDFGVHVIAHDDASTDATPEILRRLAAEYPSTLRLILQRVNQLQLGNSGAGIYLVDLETPFLAFCEGDDLWTDPYKLAKQVRFMVDRPWCTISHHDVEIWNEGGDAQYERELREHLAVRQSRSERTPGVALAEGNSILTCSAMVRTDALPSDVLRAIGDVQPEDFLVFAIAADAGDIGFIPEEMSRYRLHGQNYWASMSAPERAAFELESLWFLAVHLTGSMQERITERLVEQLRAAPPAASVAPIARIRHELSAGRAERAALEKSLDASQGALGEALSRIRDVLLQWQASQSTRHARRPD